MPNSTIVEFAKLFLYAQFDYSRKSWRSSKINRNSILIVNGKEFGLCIMIGITVLTEITSFFDVTVCIRHITDRPL